MSKLTKERLPPADREVVEMIAKGAGEIMFDHYKNLPMDDKMKLEDVIKNAGEILNDSYWMTR